MAITLTDTPAETREGVTVNTFSAHNPLLFEFTTSGSPIDTSVQVQVLDGAGSTVLGTLKNLPFNSDNTVLIDLAYPLRDAFMHNNLVDDSRLQSGDKTNADIADRFTLKYRANGTGSYTSIGDTYTAVDAVRQLGSTFGVTLAEYWPLITASPFAIDYTGAFLTLFDNPVLFWYSDVANPTTASQVSVWQLGLTFLVPIDAFGFIDGLLQEWIDSEGNVVDGDLYSLGALTANSFIVGIQEAESFLIGAEQLTIQVGVSGSGGVISDPLTETKTVKIRRACNNPIAIRWQNSLGGFDTWVFEGRTPRELQVDGVGPYGIFPTDIKTATETRRQGRKRVNEVLSVSAENLSLNEVKALQEIAYAPSVWLFVGDLTAGTAFDDWQGITVEPENFDLYDTYDSRHKIEFSFTLSEIYTVKN